MIRADLMGRGCACALAAMIVFPGGEPGHAQSRGELWNLESDGTWSPETISLGNDGTQVFTEYGSLVNSKTLLSGHDSNPPSPVWADVDTVMNFHRNVDSALRADVHATMHQEYIDSAELNKKAVLSRYSSSSSEPDWTYEFGLVLGDQPYNEVRVSDDGQRVVGAVHDMSSMDTHVAVFEGYSGVPVRYIIAETFGAFEGFVLSGDGSTAAFRSNMKLVVLDLDDGSVLESTYLYTSPFYGGIGFNGNGSLLALSSGSSVILYERGVNGYDILIDHPLPPGGQCRQLSISRDGSTLALTTNYFSDVSRVDVQVMDLATGALTVDYSVTGSGAKYNFSSGVGTSDDGKLIAVGLWGDEHQTVPELMVFQNRINTPVWTYDVPGSVLDLGFSPDGRNLAAAIKGSHASDFGSGGSFRFFEVQGEGLALSGVPRIGTRVTFEQRLPPGSVARVISSPDLDPTPKCFAGVGTLYLQRCPQMGFLPHGTQNGAGVYETPYDIPDDPNLIGTTVYFQGLGLSPRGLSDNYVKMTILP